MVVFESVSMVESRAGGFEHVVDRTLAIERLGQRAAAVPTRPRDLESHRVTSNRKCFWAVISWVCCWQSR